MWLHLHKPLCILCLRLSSQYKLEMLFVRREIWTQDVFIMSLLRSKEEIQPMSHLKEPLTEISTPGPIIDRLMIVLDLRSEILCLLLRDHHHPLRSRSHLGSSLIYLEMRCLITQCLGKDSVSLKYGQENERLKS